MRRTTGYSVVLATAMLLSSGVGGRAEEDVPTGSRLLVAVSPIAGWNRDELTRTGRGGVQTTITDTAPEYGIFAVVAHPNFVVNNFLFWTHVNDADVLGDLFFANYYLNADALVTFNAGAGYLYHEISMEGTDIQVDVPMIKTGPRFRIPPWHVTVNPYVGYAWERVETTHGDQDNDSWLYGITANWRWRMIGVSLKYYYQDSQEIADNFHTFRARLNVGITKHWGLVARVDYMEHQTTKDQSVLFGPTYVF